MFSLSGRHVPADSRDESVASAIDNGSDEVPLVGLTARGRNAAFGDSVTNLDEDHGGGLKPALGKPKKKRHIETLDLLALLTSIACSGLAVATVTNSWIAWHLRFNGQIIVIGLLLSIMNLCQARTAPYLLLLLEARFGRSTLQNYDGLLLNQFLRARLDTHWRLAIIFLLALPLGLSASYKNFDGGSTSLRINATEETGGMPAIYGLFPVPDIYSVRGNNMGLSMYFNASLPFRVASSSSNPMDPSVPDPPLPTQFPKSYGANTLVLDKTSTAFLDLPWNRRLQVLQNRLSINDSLVISADVNGCVAQCSDIPATANGDLETAYFDGDHYGYYTTELYTEPKFWIGLLSPYGFGDYSVVWIGFLTDIGSTVGQKYENLQQVATRYDITRRRCRGTWSITRGGIELLDGSCFELLSARAQGFFTGNTFFLGERWMSIIGESIGLFATARKDSEWRNISVTTMVAGLLSSSLVALNGEGKDQTVPNISAVDGKIYYANNETVTYTRSTLRRSRWLYMVLIVQPVLTLLALLISALLYSVPLDRDFGMISILAGVDRDSLGLLQGAGFSGTLEKDIHMDVMPEPRGDHTAIWYGMRLVRGAKMNGEVRRGVLYH